MRSRRAGGSDRSRLSTGGRGRRLVFFLPLLGVVWTVVSCREAPFERSESPPEGPSAVVDAHIHTGFSGLPEPASGIPDTREELFRAMRAAGVVAAVAHTRPGGEDYVDLEDRGVVHCLGISDPVDLQAVEEGLRERRFRCLKIWLGYIHRFADDPVYAPVYGLAGRFGVPVVFHTGDTYSPQARLKYAHPLLIDEVAVDFPEVNFVIAHAGYPWYRTAAQVAYKNPNVYVEASAFLVGSAAEEPPEWLERYVIDPISWIFGYVEDPSKLLFASDWPLVEMSSYVDAYRRAVPSEHWQAVFFDNAVEVFGLEDLPSVKEAIARSRSEGFPDRTPPTRSARRNALWKVESPFLALRETFRTQESLHR